MNSRAYRRQDLSRSANERGDSQRRAQRSAWPLLLGLTVFATLTPGTSSAQPAGGAATEAVWTLTPYRVVLTLAAEAPKTDAPTAEDANDASPSSASHAVVVAELLSRITTRAENVMGARWHLLPPSTLPEPDAWRPAADGDSQAHSASHGDISTEIADKVISVSLARRAGCWRVSVQEYDASTRQTGPVIRRDVCQSAKLADAAWDGILEAFRPLGLVTGVDSQANRATVLLRGAQLPGESLGDLTGGAPPVFRPIVRIEGRDGRLRTTADGNVAPPRVIPWTFLVQHRTGTNAPADQETAADGRHLGIVSGLRNPIAVRRRGRVKTLALMVRPSRKPTRLTVRARAEPHVPLPDQEVLLETPEGPPRLVGLTDVEGRFVLAAGGPSSERRDLAGPSAASAGETSTDRADVAGESADVPVILLIRSGSQMLARLPIVPGLEDELTAYVPDDRPRLRAEAFTVALGEQLIDTAMRRELLLRQADRHLAEGDMAAARKLLGELAALPDRDLFQRRIVARRAEFTSDDPLVTRRIDQLLEDARQLVARHLAPGPIQQLRERIARTAGGGD